jgi:hypothetical protein
MVNIQHFKQYSTHFGMTRFLIAATHRLFWRLHAKLFFLITLEQFIISSKKNISWQTKNQHRKKIAQKRIKTTSMQPKCSNNKSTKMQTVFTQRGRDNEPN